MFYYKRDRWLKITTYILQDLKQLEDMNSLRASNINVSCGLTRLIIEVCIHVYNRLTGPYRLSRSSIGRLTMVGLCIVF